MGSKTVIHIVSLLSILILCRSPYATDFETHSVFADVSRPGARLLTGEAWLIADKGGNGKGNKKHNKHHPQNSRKDKRQSAKSGSAKKVTICHVPPGNPGNAHSISVGAAALNAHLGHGDYAGPCRTGDPDPQPPAPAPPTVPLPPPEHNGSILVYKYHDLNQNGMHDPDEPGLNDWQFVVYDLEGNEIAGDVTRDNRRSGEAGWLRFELPPGEYRICEVLQEGWFNTGPGADEACQTLSTDAGKHGGDRPERLSFGNAYEPAISPDDVVSLRILKYYDTNQNAQYDPDEPGLNGWQIVLFDDQEQEIASSETQNHPQTGEPGWVLFENLPAADYLVCEKLQRGWINTDPGGALPCKSSGQTGPGQTAAVTGSVDLADSVDLILDDDRASGYRVTLVSHTDNTWTYIIEELSGRDLSHWNLGLPACLDHLLDFTPGAATGGDGSTGFYGIKWNVGGSFSSGEFSITVDDDYPAATIEVLAKAGDGFAVARITGPDCSAGTDEENQQDDGAIIYLGNSRRRY